METRKHNINRVLLRPSEIELFGSSGPAGPMEILFCPGYEFCIVSENVTEKAKPSSDGRFPRISTIFIDKRQILQSFILPEPKIY